MKQISPLPLIFTKFEDVGGVLDFAIFEDADGNEDSLLDAISTIISNIDREKLRQYGAKSIDDKVFYGDYYDLAENALIKPGEFKIRKRVKLINPRFRDLDKDIHCGYIPNKGEGGQFAYAFSKTPYGIWLAPKEIQKLFDEIRTVILPPGLEHEISDWSSPRLVEVSDYFEAGMEWWGVFLFTIYVPKLRRLTAIAGSATD